MNVNQKSPYYNDKTLRSREIESQCADIPAETAFAFLNDKLQEYSLHPYLFTSEQQQALLKLITELMLENLRQNGQSTDYRGISAFREEFRKSADLERQIAYNALTASHWQSIITQYKQSGRFLIELDGKYTIEPLALNLKEQPDTRFACEPSADSGYVIAFNREDEANTKSIEKEINSDPYSHFSVGHLHRTKFTLNLYSPIPETPICQSFKQAIESKLEEFKAQHGSLVPVLIIPVDGRVYSFVGGDQILAGYRITVKALSPQKQPEEAPALIPEIPKPKRGLLDKLTSLL